MKSTMDVINAAKKISEHGTNLDRLATTIADQVYFYFYTRILKTDLVCHSFVFTLRYILITVETG